MQQAAELFFRKRPQAGGAHRPLAEIAAEHQRDDHDAHDSGQAARNGSARNAQGGQAEEAVYEQRITANIQHVHKHRDEHRLLHELAAPEKGREGQIHSLEHHARADYADVEHGLVEYLLRHVHKAVNRTAEEDQYGAHGQAEDEVCQQRYGVGLAQAVRALRAQVLRY